MTTAVMNHSSFPPVASTGRNSSTQPSRRVPPPSFLNRNRNMANTPDSSKSQTHPLLTRTMQENLLLMSRPVEPEFETTLSTPGKFPNIIYGRLVAWANHRDKISQIQPKVDTWTNHNFEQKYKSQQREAWYRDRLRGLEEIAKKNSYANRLLEAVKPSFHNRLTSGDERMRKVVFHNKGAHSKEAFRVSQIQKENQKLSARLERTRTSFDFKKMDKDFERFLKHRNERVEFRKRQEQREIDEFIRSRSSSCMSNRSSDRGSVMSTMSGKNKFVKRNGKWPGMLHERTVSDECLALTRPPPIRGRRPNRGPYPPPVTTKQSKRIGSSDNLATSRSQKSNASQQSKQTSSATRVKPIKSVKVMGAGSASLRGTKPVIPPIKTGQAWAGMQSSQFYDVGDGDTLVHAKTGAATPRQSRTSTYYGGTPQQQRRKRDSSVDSSQASSRMAPSKVPTNRVSSRTSSRSSTLSKGVATKPTKQAEKVNETGELLSILLQTAPAPLVDRETANSEISKGKSSRKASAESAASRSTTTTAKSSKSMKSESQQAKPRYVGSSSSSEVSRKLPAAPKLATKDRTGSSISSISGEARTKASEEKETPTAVQQESGISQELSSDMKAASPESRKDDEKPATVGWAQKTARPDSGGSAFFTEMAKPYELETQQKETKTPSPKFERNDSAQSKKSATSEVILATNEPVAARKEEFSSEDEADSHPKPTSGWGVKVERKTPSATSATSGKSASKHETTESQPSPRSKEKAPEEQSKKSSDSSSDESDAEKHKPSGWGKKVQKKDSSSSSEDVEVGKTKIGKDKNIDKEHSPKPTLEHGEKPNIERQDSVNSKKSVVPSLVITAQADVEENRKADEEQSTARDHGTDRSVVAKLKREASNASSSSVASSAKAFSVKSYQSKKSTPQSLAAKPQAKPGPLSNSSSPRKPAERPESQQTQKSTVSGIGANKGKLVSSSTVMKSQEIDRKQTPQSLISSRSTKPQVTNLQSKSGAGPAASKTSPQQHEALEREASSQSVGTSEMNLGLQREQTMTSTSKGKVVDSSGESELIPPLETGSESSLLLIAREHHLGSQLATVLSQPTPNTTDADIVKGSPAGPVEIQRPRLERQENTHSGNSSGSTVVEKGPQKLLNRQGSSTSESTLGELKPSTAQKVAATSPRISIINNEPSTSSFGREASGISTTSATVLQATTDTALASMNFPMKPTAKTFKEEEEDDSSEDETSVAKPSGWGKPARQDSSTSESSTSQTAKISASPQQKRIIPPTPIITAPTPAAASLQRTPVKEGDSEDSDEEEESVKGYGKNSVLTGLSTSIGETPAPVEQRPGSGSSSSSSGKSLNEKQASIQPPQQQARPSSATRGSNRSTPRTTMSDAQHVAESRLEEDPDVLVTMISANRPTVQRTVQESDESSVTSTSTSTDATPRETNRARITAGMTTLSVQKEETTISSGSNPGVSKQIERQASSTSSGTYTNTTEKNEDQLNAAGWLKASQETTASSMDLPKTSSPKAAQSSSYREKDSDSSDEDEKVLGRNSLFE